MAFILAPVAAIRAGAVDYLVKPADDETVVRAVLGGLPAEAAMPPARTLCVDAARWEHIERVFELYGRSISECARRLGMHRRTLQRLRARRLALE